MLRKRLDECLSQHLQIASLSRQAKLFPWRLPFPLGETCREYSLPSRHWTLLECALENIAEWERESKGGVNVILALELEHIIRRTLYTLPPSEVKETSTKIFRMS